MGTGWRRLTMISDDKLETDFRVNFLRYANHDRNKSTHTNPKHKSHKSYSCPFLFRKLKLSRGEEREKCKRGGSEGFMKLLL